MCGVAGFMNVGDLTTLSRTMVVTRIDYGETPRVTGTQQVWRLNRKCHGNGCSHQRITISAMPIENLLVTIDAEIAKLQRARTLIAGTARSRWVANPPALLGPRRQDGNVL